MMKKYFSIICAVLLGFIVLPENSQAQMQTKAGDMVLTAGAGLSALSFGFNGNFQFNVTDKIAAHPSINYNNYGGGAFISVDAWGGYHGLKSIPYLGSAVEGKDNVDAYFMAGPTFYKDNVGSGFAFGAGGGGRYFFNEKMAVTAEGKYRVMLGGNYVLSWYELGLGFSYAL